MSKKVTAVLTVLVLALGIGAAVVSGMGHEGTWKGEIVDVACHVTKGEGGTGKGHAPCGAKCVEAGLPVGLLVGETTYILISADHKPLNKALAPHVGHIVEVTGTKFEKAGSNLITVKDFKMAK